MGETNYRIGPAGWNTKTGRYGLSSKTGKTFRSAESLSRSLTQSKSTAVSIDHQPSTTQSGKNVSREQSTFTCQTHGVYPRTRQKRRRNEKAFREGGRWKRPVSSGRALRLRGVQNPQQMKGLPAKLLERFGNILSFESTHSGYEEVYEWLEERAVGL